MIFSNNVRSGTAVHADITDAPAVARRVWRFCR